MFWVESGPAGPFNRTEIPGVARGECRTHHWSMKDQREIHDNMCPIGRIEDTLDKALEQIRKAMK